MLNVQIVETGPGGGRALFKARTCSLVSRLADVVAGECLLTWLCHTD